MRNHATNSNFTFQSSKQSKSDALKNQAVKNKKPATDEAGHKGLLSDTINANSLANQKANLAYVIRQNNKTKSFEEAWELFIQNLAKQIANKKSKAPNISVINSLWYQQSKEILIQMIEENPFVDILGQFEYEYLLKNLPAYEKYEWVCCQGLEYLSKDHINEAILNEGEYNFGNTEAGSGITALKFAKKFVGYGFDINKLFVACFECNQHPYELCLIQLYYQKTIRFSIELVKNYNHISVRSRPEKKLYDAIIADCVTKRS